jgi:hypothetical protein
MENHPLRIKVQSTCERGEEKKLKEKRKKREKNERIISDGN